MSENDKIKFHAELLFSKFQKLTLEAAEAAEILGLTPKMLENARHNSTGIPYTRLNGNERSKPLYLITTIAEEIIKREVKTFN